MHGFNLNPYWQNSWKTYPEFVPKSLYPGHLLEQFPGNLVQLPILEFVGMSLTHFWKTHPKQSMKSRNHVSGISGLTEIDLWATDSILDEFSRYPSSSCPGNINSGKFSGLVFQSKPFLAIFRSRSLTNLWKTYLIANFRILESCQMIQADFWKPHPNKSI